MPAPLPCQNDPKGGTPADAAIERPRRRQWLPLALLVAIAGTILAAGWHEHLSLKTIGLNYEALRGFISANLAAALAIYFASYLAVVALSLPGALVLTLAGGLLFGWKIAAPATVVAATAGATIIFLVARSSLGSVMASRVGPWLTRLRKGFSENALSYLLFLRLVPAFPFVVVNLAAAVLGVPLRTYVLGTFLGIIPGTTAIAVAGAGLGSVIKAQNRSYHACLAAQPADPGAACPYRIDTSALLTKELILALVLLGIVALIPVALKKWRARDAAV
ncbi:MAG TPA: VTT domain-containing protein [Hyphomicrobiaceae bacterium]|nr:VTT domain-containing protein [Hyphomicrobiaceae bacterium]